MKKSITLLIGLLVLTFGAIGIYQELTKPSITALRLTCHKETTTFERPYGTKAEIQTAQRLLQEGAYSITASAQPSKYMKSRLFESVSLAQTDTILRNLLAPPKTSENNVSINYAIYENDKMDPGKKSPKSKLFEGYVTFEYRLEKKLIYKVQIDFMDPQGKDISRRIECAVASFMSI